MKTPEKKYRPYRRPLGYLAFFLTAAALFLFLVLQEKSPDQKIIGKWREVSWEYEKVNLPQGTGGKPGQKAGEKEGQSSRVIADHVRDELAQDLMIHRAETWEFLPNGKLLLHHSDGKTVQLAWHLKGRGHVLKLHYPNNQLTEYYDLDELSRKDMTLYFDIEIQAKGIVRMKFEKIT